MIIGSGTYQRVQARIVPPNDEDGEEYDEDEEDQDDDDDEEDNYRQQSNHVQQGPQIPFSGTKTYKGCSLKYWEAGST